MSIPKSVESNLFLLFGSKNCFYLIILDFKSVKSEKLSLNENEKFLGPS